MATPDPTYSNYPPQPSYPKYPIYPVPFSQCLSVKLCQCGDHLRRWKVRKESPNRGRVFLNCQTAWPIDPTGRTISCPSWHWEDELDPTPEIFSFDDQYRSHPDTKAYFQSLDFLKRNSARARELLGMKVKIKTREVGTQTEAGLPSMELLQLEDSNDFSLRYSPGSQQFVTPYLSPRNLRRREREGSHSGELILFPGENTDDT